MSDPSVEFSNADVPLLRLPLAMLSQPITGELLDRLPEVDELVVGYLEPPDLDDEFLRLAPNVTHVLIYSSRKHVEWLRPLTRLQMLAISRSVKHLKVLRELMSLENISFPGWPPSADGPFALPQRVRVRYGATNAHSAWCTVARIRTALAARKHKADTKEAPMGKSVKKAVFGLVWEALAPLGYRQRSAGIFTRAINEEAVGRVALSNVDLPPLLRITPNIGVRYLPIEKIYEELMAEEWRRDSWKPSGHDATLYANLGTLRPQGEPSSWEFVSGTDHAASVHELVAAIESDGQRFMEAHASLPAVARALMDGDRYGARGPRNLHRPIACYLLGDYDQALALLDDPKNLTPAYIKARFRRQIEHAAGRPITEEAPAIEQPPDLPPWPSEPQPREIRHRETGVVLLRLDQPIEYRANLRGANLAGADLAGLKALGADFRRANLTGARLDQAELLGPDLRDANLTGASLRGVLINVSNAHRVNLSNADLRDAHLTGLFLHGARLTGADLRGATLAQSDLMQANLRGADLRGAKCPNTVFSGADLREAKLEGIDLGADQSSGPARYDRKTRWPKGFEPQAHGAISDPAGPIIWRL